MIRKESSYLFILAAVDMCLCVSLCVRHFRSPKNQGYLENSIFNHYLTWLLMQLRRQLARLWWHQPPGTSICVDYPENYLYSSVLKDYSYNADCSKFFVRFLTSNFRKFLYDQKCEHVSIKFWITPHIGGTRNIGFLLLVWFWVFQKKFLFLESILVELYRSRSTHSVE